MTRPERHPMKKALALPLIVAAAVLWWATPASAHANEVTGDPETPGCLADGTRKITWTITNDFDLPETVTYTGASNGTAEIGPLDSVEITTVVPGDVTATYELTVTGRWSDQATHAVTSEAFAEGDCDQPPTPPSVNPCEAAGTCSDDPAPPESVPATPIVTTELAYTGPNDKVPNNKLAAVGALMIGAGLLILPRRTRGLTRGNR